MTVAEAFASTPLPLHAADEIAAAMRTALHGLPEPFACSPAQLRQRDALTDALAGIARLRAWVDASCRLVAAQTSIIQADAALQQELNEGERLATVREYALELLFALDERQKNYRPLPHAEVVELVHGLLELTDFGQVVTVESGMTPGDMETQP